MTLLVVSTEDRDVRAARNKKWTAARPFHALPCARGPHSGQAGLHGSWQQLAACVELLAVLSPPQRGAARESDQERRPPELKKKAAGKGGAALVCAG